MAYDTWGGSWGTSWALSWTKEEAVAPVTTVTPPLVGGGIPHDYVQTKRDISRARKRFGLEDEVARKEAEAVIAEVAARQVVRLEKDAQKRFEELSRELQLRGIEWESRYLESLNVQRERLIDAEIGRRLRALQEEQEILILLFMAAGAV